MDFTFSGVPYFHFFGGAVFAGKVADLAWKITKLTFEENISWKMLFPPAQLACIAISLTLGEIFWFHSARSERFKFHPWKKHIMTSWFCCQVSRRVTLELKEKGCQIPAQWPCILTSGSSWAAWPPRTAAPPHWVPSATSPSLLLGRMTPINARMLGWV